MDELLRIDPEFESKIPPLTAEEYQLLEENILQDGVVLNPLIVWNGCIVDGHNRFRIIQAHPEIKYTVFEKEFPDRYAAIAWICCNQLGRRNLTPQQKKYLIGQRYEAEKQTASFHGNQHTLADESGGGQNDHYQHRAPIASPVPIEKSADLEMDGRVDLQNLLCLWAAELKQSRLRRDCRSHRLLRIWVPHTSL